MVCSRLSLVDGEPLEKVGISGRLARVEQQVKKNCRVLLLARQRKFPRPASFLSLACHVTALITQNPYCIFNRSSNSALFYCHGWVILGTTAWFLTIVVTCS